ncbi:MAG: peptide chain release factor N(5)-glutamine methyltransferase [Limisphaerales bacterium]
MTVLEAIQKSTEFLTKKGVESPRLQTELLLAHLLEMPRMKLYLNFERALTTVETDALRELIKRRSQREPLQHITGSTSFCGYEIIVNRNVLVPRPETELLAELGWQFLSTLNQQPSTALDFCTGSGCIAIALAAKCPNSKIVAADISADALALARENVARNNVAERVEFLQGDRFTVLKAGWGERPREPSFANVEDGSPGVSPHLFDLIISNPPYIPSAEIASLQPEVRDFDPRLALDGGADGLEFYRLIASQSKAFLKKDGKVMVEFGDGQGKAIQKIFETEKWIVEAVKEDYSHRARILIARTN